jgi:hypothetical protein
VKRVVKRIVKRVVKRIVNWKEVRQRMIEIQERGGVAGSDQLSLLARDFQTRIVNCSPTGCLLETNSAIEVGTVGTLSFIIDGREFADDVQVVRCQPIQGAGSMFQIGIRFLWTTVPRKDSLRLALCPVVPERAARLA